MIKDSCVIDGLLSLYILVLMDDTVFLATTRNLVTRKVQILEEYYKEYGIIVNQSEQVFFFL